jgi:hypothetical protein
VSANVVAVRPVAIRLSADGRKLETVPRYRLYDTEQLFGGATALQARLIWFADAAVAVNEPGAEGRIAQVGPPPTTGSAFWTSWTNWAWN